MSADEWSWMMDDDDASSSMRVDGEGGVSARAGKDGRSLALLNGNI